MFRLSCIIADTPTRSLVKCTVPFNAYRGCEKCGIMGAWKGRVIFPELKAELRTDLSFATVLIQAIIVEQVHSCSVG